MLDHINWYLVELERRLRSKRSAQSTADFLLETRSHLEERVLELEGKGMDHVSAAKAALTDFGDPDTVVRSYSGASGMSSRSFRTWVAVACLPAIGFAFGMTYWLSQMFVLVDSSMSWTLAMPWIAIALTLVIAWKTRRWVGAYVVGVGLVSAVLGSMWIASHIELISVEGHDLVAGVHRQEQIALREAWLSTYDADFQQIQRWRAVRGTQEGDRLLGLLMTSKRLAPYPTAYPWSGREGMLPNTTHQRNVLQAPLDPRNSMAFTLRSVYDDKGARQMWADNVDQYVAFLKRERIDVDTEIRALQNPLPSTFWDRWVRMGLPLVAATAIGGLLVLLLNALVIGLYDLRQRARRTAWRRQVG